MRKQSAFWRNLEVIGLSVIIALTCTVYFSAQAAAAYAQPQDMGSVSEEYASGGVGETAPEQSIRGLKKASSLSAPPAQYDSRDYGNVTPVRDQRPLGVCWSFATISAIESSLLAHGQVSSPESLDLSERQLAYFTYNLEPDPLGNTAGDQNKAIKYGTGDYLNNDGNVWMTSNVMASGIGLVNETDAPTYQDLLNKWEQADCIWSTEFENDTKLDAALARGANSWTLSSVKRLPMTNNTTARNVIKNAIMDHGGLAVLTYLDTGDSYPYTKVSWNEENAAYYNYNLNDCNHLVTIVGWDDNYSKENFLDSAHPKEDNLPAKNGAWLCKNSYGTDWGEDGYYWLSYEDRYFSQSEVGAYAIDVRPVCKSEILYQYDGTGSDYYNKLPSGGSIANMFTVAGAGEKNEVLQSVCIMMLDDTDVNYSIQIYTDCTDDSDPTSGKAALATPQTGKTSWTGYYTIPLDKKVFLKKGSKFAVVATLSHDDGSTVIYDSDESSHSLNWVRYISAVSPNQSFVKKGENASWYDLATEKSDGNPDYPGVARIKAITLPADGVDISEAMVIVPDCVYNGKNRKPLVAVNLQGKSLTQGIDYEVSYENNLNAGAAMVTVTGIGKYTGQAQATFTIKPKEIDPVVLLSADHFKYSGKPRIPDLTVQADDAQLDSSQYTVTYPQDCTDVGVYTVNVELTGNYSGTKSVTYCIDPKRTKLTKLTGGKKKITVKWKKQKQRMSSSRITGYEIQYSTKKSFRSNTKSVFVKGAGKAKRTIKKLKGKKTYYVKIRTYMIVGDATLYSPWSASRSVRTR